MFVIASLSFGAFAGYQLSLLQMLGVLGIFFVAYVILHRGNFKGVTVATACFFMLYFTLAMFISCFISSFF
jgi:hypothetical protein